MDSSELSVREDGQSTSLHTPPLRRRYSMEEDLYYNRVMSAPLRRLSQPPAYETNLIDSDEGENPGPGRRKGSQTVFDKPDEAQGQGSESLPNYQSSVYIEGVFAKKHEIENTIKRAEDRHWHTAFVTLNGTALNVYTVKKDWGWGRSRDGPTICPDNPPWVRKSRLEKSYSLIHADAGIAADYTKRRYVIRIRAETDQFLLSCIELTTFVKWLEALFAAIDVAAPIDDRDFPRDMSIPRIQRVRWFQGQSPALPSYTASPEPPRHNETSEEGPEVPNTMAQAGAGDSSSPAAVRLPLSHQPLQEASANPPPRIEALNRRISTSSYFNPSVDPHTGKWLPEHTWSSAHDLLYAKLCYSNLLFRSPRKSNYIISKGKQWFVDWGTGKMVRVLPPTYGEIDFFGPWQVIHTENPRI
ncbi:Pleckstrin-domain containing protein [Metarhizium rileyi]|uniref:Pleckstrin-domain containing protein n=1 Tax=Metarhizium rileyi (strain RCEF 4871) TaxID=1649241 RepID=A0A167AG33_METRR|nr:Pleckstrin-domain containing protein [Metarhizium rileyi RCEF 4871]TWU77353.1 hypothetical protein ED733_005615 [Metarhizium rileyi]